MFGKQSTARRARAVCTLVGFAALAGSLAACNDNDIDGPIGGVAVVRDQSFNFSTLRTFAMPDTVIQFTALTGTPQPVPRTYDQTALNEVRANLLARGYVQVSDPATTKPDFVVLLGESATTNYNAFVSYPWYGYYGFYSGWGWYAPGFNTSWNLVYPWYATVGVTAYDRGTLVVTFVPTLSVNPTNRTINASWAGVATALADGDITAGTVSSAVDQMFTLSPYLVAGTSTASRAAK